MARKKAARKRAVRAKPIGSPVGVTIKMNRLNIEDLPGYTNTISVCEVEAYRDKHGVVLSFGGNEALREEAWLAGKGADQINSFVNGLDFDGESVEDSMSLDEWQLRSDIAEIITETEEDSAKRDERMLDALKLHLTWDEPDTKATPDTVKAELQKRIPILLAAVGALV